MKMHARWAAGAVFAALMLGVGPASLRLDIPAQAQLPGQRVVEGVVLNADGSAIAGATVFLRNQKNKAIRSYTSVNDGKFRFAQVNMNEDFDLWAEKDGKKSVVKTVSSWDARKDFATELKIK